jgi:hypothetical protein
MGTVVWFAFQTIGVADISSESLIRKELFGRYITPLGYKGAYIGIKRGLCSESVI